jgi:pimeloyl-ACP methyl ester carboxylesterase
MDFSDYARLARNSSEGLYADIDDIRLHYVREGDGEPLLLIHGGLGLADSGGPSWAFFPGSM